MYVFPNTDIYFLTDVNLNNDYDHTIFFQTASPPADPRSYQTTYFMGKRKFTLTNQSYQRKERGWLKVEIPQNSLWDCTYMMYRNTAYGDKWFYAFINKTEYINDTTTKINFEIDVLQTWFFDYQLDKCFVEREHTETDELFENIVEENLDLGDDFKVQLFRRYNLEPDRIAVVFTSDVDTSTSPPSLLPANARKIGDYFSGVGIIGFDTSTQSGLDQLGDFLHDYIDNGFEDAILSIYQYPHFISTLVLDPYNTDTWEIPANFVNLDGYVPKNKKLFNYPYNFLKLTNNKGDDVIFKHEMWDNESDIGKFELRGVGLGVPSVMCYPCNYRDMPKDFENGLMYTGFNECAWVGDAYQIWLAQNRKNLELATKLGAGALLVGGALVSGALAGGSGGLTLAGTIPTVIGGGLDVLSAGSAGSVSLGASASLLQGMQSIGGKMITGGAGSILGSIYTKLRAQNKLEATPRPAHGHINNDIFNMQNDLCGYTCYQMTIRNKQARIIDEYFSRFGYACHRIKIPNRNARRNWTYVKTDGCELNGNIPSDDLNLIKAIYNNGVTFWTNGDNIGNYGDFSNPVYSS